MAELEACFSEVEATERTAEPKSRGRRRRRRRHRSRSTERDTFEPYHASVVPRACELAVAMPEEDRPISTVMLRNIPCRYTQGSLLQEIDQLGFEGSYDFFYLPMDMRNKNSVGYAFINFTEPAHAQRFFEVMKSHRFRRYCSDKLPKASPAHLQGLQNNILHFVNRAVSNCRDTRYRPVVLKPGGRRLDLHEALAELGMEALPGQAAPAPKAHSETDLVEASRMFAAAKSSLEAAIAQMLAGASKGPEDAGVANVEQELSGWVDKAFRELVREADPRQPRRGFGVGWVAETFAKIVGGTPVTPRGTCRANVLCQIPPTAWEHPQGKVGGWVDEAFTALTDNCSDVKDLPSRSLSERRVGGALQQLKSLGGWAWVAFA